MYEYACQQCGARFEKLRRMAEADEPSTCAVCGAAGARRLLSTFAASGCSAGPGGQFT